MTTLRNPAVAGLFYPASPSALRRELDQFLSQTKATGPTPKALIVPHAGYIYSGPVAASAYGLLREARTTIRKVVLLGPAHRTPVRGLAAHSADRFVSPLGEVALDREAIEGLLVLPQVSIFDAAHDQEHSLEVHLPFLQVLLAEFQIIPLVVGEASPEQVCEVLEQVWGGPETLIVVSSDLSHYHDYVTARAMDTQTSASIEALEPDKIRYEHACGRNPVNGLLLMARKRGLQAATLDLRSSGDTAGPRDQVVGYGAYAFH